MAAMVTPVSSTWTMGIWTEPREIEDAIQSAVGTAFGLLPPKMRAMFWMTMLAPNAVNMPVVGEAFRTGLKAIRSSRSAAATVIRTPKGRTRRGSRTPNMSKRNIA